MKKADVMPVIEKAASRPVVAWSVAAVLGILNMLPNRFVMNPDGISYLNLASLYQQGDWASAINGYWSPLYPLLLAAWLRIVPSSPAIESTAVHWLTFLIYLGTFAAFRFFLCELRASQIRAEITPDDKPSALTFQSFSELACAHALFFWCALSLIGLSLVTPDLTLAAIVFVAAGLIVRLRRTDANLGYLGLGAVIGLGYLSKSVMFPLGAVTCLCCALPAKPRVAARRTLLALAGFMIVSIPQLIAMTKLSGKLSYGETGTIAYANEVNRVPKFWVGLPTGTGTPVHSMRVITRKPWAFDLSIPNTAFSNPASDQIAHWMQGVRPHVSLSQQFDVTTRILGWYIWLFEVLVFATVALFLLRKRFTLQYVSLIIPALATFGVYALVYSESRYVGAMAVILFLCVAASFKFGGKSHRGVMAVMGALGLFYGFSVLSLTRGEVANTFTLSRQQSQNPQFDTSVELERLGVKRGSRVAGIGYMFNAYWARLAGVQIGMQLPEAYAFSASSDSVRAGVLDSLSAAGAVAVVSTGRPRMGPGEQWQKVGPAEYWILMLPRR